MAEAMVAIEHVHEHLKTVEKARRKTPDDHPAFVADHNALLLREQFTEFLRTGELQAQPTKFQQLAQEAESAALALEDALNSPEFEAAWKLFLIVINKCKACHQAFRDVPLREKKMTASPKRPGSCSVDV